MRMKLDRLLEVGWDLPVIESALLRALGEEPKALSVQLDRWVRSGRLIRIRRGVYVLPSRLQRTRHPIDRVANLVVRPSYVSAERALHLQGLIPETVPIVVSMTTVRSARFASEAGTFEYRHVSTDWFFGFRELEVGGGSAMVAVPEKALLDLVATTPGEFSVDRIRELRLEAMDLVDLDLVQAMAKRSARPRLERFARRIRRLVRGQEEIEL